MGVLSPLRGKGSWELSPGYTLILQEPHTKMDYLETKWVSRELKFILERLVPGLG